MRLRRGNGSARHAARSCATEYFFVIGISSERVRSWTDVNDTASCAWVSASKRCISGTSPTVDTVMRRWEKSTPHEAVSVSMAPTVPR